MDLWDELSLRPQDNLEKSLVALRSAQDSQDFHAQAEALAQAGWCYFFLSQQAEALEKFNSLREMATSQNNLLWKQWAFLGLGAAYQQLSRYDLALEHLLQAMEQAQENHNVAGQIETGRRLGEVYLTLEKPLEGLEYFLKAERLAEKHAGSATLADILLCLGESYLTLHRNDQALEYLSHALVLTKENAHRSGEARALTLIGLIYRDIGELDISEEYHLESLKLCQAGNNAWGLLEAHLNLGNLHLLRSKYETAILHFEKVIILATQIDSRLHLAKAYASLSSAWEKTGDFQKALGYERQADSLERDLRADEIAQKTRNLMIQQEFEQNRAQTEILRLKSERLEKKTNELAGSLDSLRMLSDWGRQIAGALTPDDLFSRIYESLSHLVTFRTFGLALFHAKTRTLHFPYIMKDRERLNSPFAPLLVHHLDKITPNDAVSALLLNDISQVAAPWLDAEAIAPVAALLGAQSGIILPLLEGEKLRGLLFVAHSEPQAYRQQDANTLGALGGFIAVALKNTLNHRKVRRLNQALRKEAQELEQANRQIQHLAQHDLLTGLANRRLLTEFLAKTIPFCQRTKRGFALYFLDLDGFKPVNDHWGHDAGDWVLTQLGKKLKDLLRDSDLVARVGGDEFVAIALEVEQAEQAVTVAQKLTMIIQEPLVWENTPLQLGVSIGISLFPLDGTTAEELINQADNAMYRVKNHGKHGWAFATETAN